LGSTGFGTGYDMEDMQSTASFNSRMFDQFKDMDSISQFGEDQGIDEANLTAIKMMMGDREKKIRALHADKLKLKALLKKAKTAIDMINNKHKEASENVRLTETKLQHQIMTNQTQ